MPNDFDQFKEAFEHMLGAMRRARSRTSRELTGGEISFSQFQLLSALADGPRSVGDLADDAGVTSPTMTRMLDGLEQLGIVERRQSERDRRALSITVTDKGRELLKRKQQRFERLTNSIFSSLSESERESIAPLLNRMAEAIEEL